MTPPAVLSSEEREALEATHSGGQIGCNHAALGRCVVVRAVERILMDRMAAAWDDGLDNSIGGINPYRP